MQFFVGGRTRLDEAGRAVAVAAVHAVQHQAMQMDVQVGCRAEALDQGDRAALTFVALEPRVIQQMPLDQALLHLQYRRDQLGLRGQQHAKRDRPLQHPLPHRHVRVDMAHQARCRLRHPPGPALGVKGAPLATEGNSLAVAAVGMPMEVTPSSGLGVLVHWVFALHRSQALAPTASPHRSTVTGVPA